MLDFAIFAVTFISVLLIAVFYLYPGSPKRGTTIPGADPSDPKDGNICDIQQSGSLHEYLVELHDTYGPIASFWLGSQLVVSLASAKLFQQHSHVFDRAGDLFGAFKPLLGPSSVFFGNGASARQQHRVLSELLSKARCERHLATFDELSEEMVEKLKSLPHDQHVPLHQYMLAVALKALAVSLLGDHFRDTKNILDFRKNYEICMLDIEQKLQGKNLEDVTKGTTEKAISEMRRQVLSVTRERRTGAGATELLIDSLIKLGYDDERIVDTLMAFVHWGFQTTGNLLTWVFYHLAANPEVQQKVHDELSSVVEDGVLDGQRLDRLRFLQQTVDEALRLSCVVPFATRCQDVDVEVGGHTIPKGTPIIHALGVLHNDSKTWSSSPQTFDPERFGAEAKSRLPQFAFAPFGFGGSRTCPGIHFTRILVAVVVAKLLRTFNVRLLEDQVVLANFCIFTKPVDEIWVSMEKRGC